MFIQSRQFQHHEENRSGKENQDFIILAMLKDGPMVLICMIIKTRHNDNIGNLSLSFPRCPFFQKVSMEKQNFCYRVNLFSVVKSKNDLITEIMFKKC